MAELVMNIKATDNASKQVNTVSKSIDGIEKNAKQATTATKTLGDSLGKAFFAIEILKTGFEAGKKVFEFMDKNSVEFGKSMDQIKGVAEKVAGVFTQLLAPAIEGAVKFISEMMKSKPFIDSVAGAFTVLSQVVKTIVDVVGTELSNIFNTLQTTFSDLFKNIGQNVDAFDVLGGILQYISSAFKIVSTNIQGVIKVLGSIVQAYQAAGDVIMKTGKLISNPLDATNRKEFLDSVTNAGKSVIDIYSTAGKAIADSFGTAFDEFKNFGNGAKEFSKITEKEFNNINKNIDNSINGQIELNQKVYNNNMALIQAREKANQEALDKELDQWEDFAEDQKKNSIDKMVENFKTGFQKFQQIASQVGSAIQSVMSSIFSAVQNDFSNQLKTLESDYKNTVKSIDEETQKRLEQMGLADQTELEKAQEKYDKLLEMNQEYNSSLTEMQEAQLSSLEEKIVNQSDSEIQEAIRKKREKEMTGNQEALAEAEKELEKQKILDQSNKKKAEAEKNFQKEKADIEKKAFETKKANDTAQVWITTALGVAGAWSSAMMSSGNPIVGAVIAGIATAALLANAGIQTGIIQSQNYTPAFAGGGIVPGDSYTGDTVLSRLNSGEMVLNREQQSNLFDQINTGTGGNNPQQINIYLDSQLFMSKLILNRKFAEVR